MFCHLNILTSRQPRACCLKRVASDLPLIYPFPRDIGHISKLPIVMAFESCYLLFTLTTRQPRAPLHKATLLTFAVYIHSFHSENWSYFDIPLIDNWCHGKCWALNMIFTLNNSSITVGSSARSWYKVLFEFMLNLSIRFSLGSTNEVYEQYTLYIAGRLNDDHLHIIFSSRTLSDS